jgi:hypothetical protein
MSVIEFQTYVQHGAIELPKEYIDRVKGRIRVIILTNEESDDADMVEFFMEHPFEMADFTPLTRDMIYDHR